VPADFGNECENLRFITEIAGQRQSQRSREKRCQKQGSKLSNAELEAMVRQMIPEQPEAGARSRASEVAVKAFQGSVRGLFVWASFGYTPVGPVSADGAWLSTHHTCERLLSFSGNVCNCILPMCFQP